MTAIPRKNGEEREFLFTESDFERVRTLIYGHAGISLNPSKQDMVYSRLARRLRALGIPSFSSYLHMLENDDSEEWEGFINALTTNLTSFFREPHHFPILAEHLRKKKNTHIIQLWCSAASTGEEPYSMAMTAVEAFGTLTPPVKILATDLDTNVLEKGRQGIYTIDRIEKLSQNQVKRFFLRGDGAQEGYVRVRKELRDMITFRQLNLLDAAWPMKTKFDAIFCRNVMIYFDKQTQYDVLEKFMRYMHPDGLLFAGHSESFQQAVNLFRPCGRTVYALQGK